MCHRRRPRLSLTQSLQSLATNEFVYGDMVVNEVHAMKISRICSLLATILTACVLGAPHLAAAKTVAIARPTHLRQVQSKADCAAALSLLAVICGSGIQQGDLQLIWDESTKNVDGYRVYRVDGGGHQLLGSTAARF